MNEQVRLITNKENHSFYNEIRNAFDNCIGFYFSVAFINYSGLQLIVDEFEELRNKGICGQIITTDYLS